MADKYRTVQREVQAVQYTFNVLKELYLFLGMKDITFSVKDRTLGAIITGASGEKLSVSKNDFVVKDSDGGITIWKPDDFKKEFVAVAAG